MPWIDGPECPSYCFLPTGELEYRDRWGNYRLAGGCNGKDFWLWGHYRSEAIQILDQAPEGSSMESCYLEHSRFRWLCDWCLSASGIDPDWVGIPQVRWLLFASKQGEQIIPAALDQLNQLPEPRHPGRGDGVAISDRAAFLAALVGHCDGDAAAAFELALSQPARELMAVMAEHSWQSLSDKDRSELALSREAERIQEEQGGLVVPMDAIAAMRGGGGG